MSEFKLPDGRKLSEVIARSAFKVMQDRMRAAGEFCGEWEDLSPQTRSNLLRAAEQKIVEASIAEVES